MQLKTKVILGSGLLGLGVAAYVTVGAAIKFNPSEQPVGYVGQPAVSSINVASGSASMFTIDYDAKDWSGNLHSFSISKIGAVGNDDRWGDDANPGAGAVIRAQAQRNIVTLNDAPPGANVTTGLEFTWANMSAARRALLAPAAGDDGAAVLDYLRGATAKEGQGYRVRKSGLGDIIHSTPVYWDGGTSRTVFVGANDGMLHAINAVDGSERFAYIPGAVFANLAKLSSPTYVHQYYVDGRLDVKQFGTQTILAGTLGAGGKAVFGLDVSTMPANQTQAAARVLWEVSPASSGFGDLGYTYGAPTLAVLPGAVVNSVKGKVEALVMGNGYANGGSGKAVLYLINPKSGKLIHAFVTSVGDTDSPNGLSSPSLWDSDRDGIKDTAYAGDLEGNLWKFSLTAPYGAPVLLQQGGGGQGAITMAPGVMLHPLGGAMVTYVTGRMLDKLDPLNVSLHSAYGIWDGAPSQNDDLLVQTLAESEHGASVKTRVRTVTNTAPKWSKNGHRGWRTELLGTGERVVGDGAYVTGGVFQFFTHNPTKNLTSTPPGENWWMQLNALTGGSINRVVFDLNGDSKFDAADEVSAGKPVGRYMGGGVRSQLVALSAGGVDVFQSNFDRNGVPGQDKVTSTTTTVGGDRGVSGGHFDTDFFCYQECGGLYQRRNDQTLEDNGFEYYNKKPLAGHYSEGYGSDSHNRYLNYIHVHEYDDIYDTVGLNMLAPSQDLQRLGTASPRASTATTVTQSPDTPDLQAKGTLPSSAVRKTTTAAKGPVITLPKPSTVPAYTHGTAAAVGTPVASTDANGDALVTSVKRYTSKAVLVTVVNPVQNAKKRWNYSEQTDTYTWSTDITTVERTSKRFKVLMANQYLSPAVQFTIDGASGALANGTYSGPAWKFQSTAGLSAAQLPSYQLGTIRSLVLFMPLDAFNEENWRKDGDIRTGLHPTTPKCLGVNNKEHSLGKEGAWRNGALTVQIVTADVTDADIQLNVADKPSMGYRLKNASQTNKLVAEYLIYWHHPKAVCHASSNFTATPGQDASKPTARPGTPAAGAQDPHGEFVPGSGTGSTPTVPANPPAEVVDNLDGSTTTTTTTYEGLKGGVGYTKTVTVTISFPPGSGGGGTGILTGGVVNSVTTVPGSTGSTDGAQPDPKGISKNAANLGRINWRELQK